MLIKEIEPIGTFGKSIVSETDSNELYEMIELPLRQACKILKDKGIETVMSSANKNNILCLGQRRLEKEDVCNQEFYLDSPTFEDIGRGYAWIMLNFDSLSCQNKELLFHLEQKKDKAGNKTGEKAIWFMRGSSSCFDIVAPSRNFQRQKSSENKKEKELSDKFEKRHIVLSYNDGYYPKRVVSIRMPINEKTTAEEVDVFFKNFARSFQNQEKEVKINQKEVLEMGEK